MHADLNKNAKYDFEKKIFNVMNNAVFGKTMENVQNHRDIELIITETRRDHLVSEPNYHTTKYFPDNVFTTEMKRTQHTREQDSLFRSTDTGNK